MYIGGSIHCAMCVQVKTGNDCMIYNDYSLFLSWYTHGSKNRQQYISISWQGRMERTWQSLLFPVLPRNHSVQNLQRRARKYFLFSEKFPCSDDFLHSAIWNNVTIVKKINDVFLETFPISLFPPDPKLWTWLFRLSFPKVTDVAFHGNPLTWILL